MSKLVIGLAAFVLLAAGGALAGGAITDSSSDDPATTAGITTDGRTTTSTKTGEDVRGPCDEAEHANDPRCAPAATSGGEVGDDDVRDDDDVRGEHRRRGRGERNEDHNEDRSGPNPGCG